MPQFARRTLFPSVYTASATRKTNKESEATPDQSDTKTHKQAFFRPISAARPDHTQSLKEFQRGSESPRSVEKFPVPLLPKLSLLQILPLSEKSPRQPKQTVTGSIPRRSIWNFDATSMHQSGEPIPGVPLYQPGCNAPHVTFDPRITVREFTRSRDEYKIMWHSKREMKSFRKVSMERIFQYDAYHLSYETAVAATAAAQLVATGTPRILTTHKPQNKQRRRVLFSHKALSTDADKEFLCTQVAKEQIKKILVIDPHFLSLKLFHKSLQKMLPYSTIITCQSLNDAAARFGPNQPSFDIIVGDDGMLHELRNRVLSVKNSKKNQPLVISVSTHSTKNTLTSEWVDFHWSKPPPAMNTELRESLLEQLLKKRRKEKLLQHL